MLRVRSPLAAAFTLIELLTVIAIIGILAAITFGVARGVQERAAISQARSELATLAVALEAYKRQYGDYPQTGIMPGTTPPTTLSATNVPGYLFNAMAGKLGPKRAAIDGRAVIDLSRMTLASTTAVPAVGGSISVANAFFDPWGRAYVYSYRDNGATAGNWINPSYVLFSAGPDGNFVAIPDSGIINREAGTNADNVYP
jgi:prepilin-type N-terminal cleavage/methylation domain-containing protein